MPTITQTPKKTEEEAIEEQGEAKLPIEKKEEKKMPNLYPWLLSLCFLFCLIFGIFLGYLLRPAEEAEVPHETEEAAKTLPNSGMPDWVTEAIIDLDGISRSGEKLEAVRDIAVHYVANPGTSAMANRNYFNGPDSSTSAHFIVGLEGEVLLCVPTDEKSCATNERNPDTISVEVCHPDETGEFSDQTYESLVRLLAYLCKEYDLTEENIIRHYDVTGKMCPLYYVENPDAWEDLKQAAAEKIKEGEI